MVSQNHSKPPWNKWLVGVSPDLASMDLWPAGPWSESPNRRTSPLHFRWWMPLIWDFSMLQFLLENANCVYHVCCVITSKMLRWFLGVYYKKIPVGWCRYVSVMLDAFATYVGSDVLFCCNMIHYNILLQTMMCRFLLNCFVQNVTTFFVTLCICRFTWKVLQNVVAFLKMSYSLIIPFANVDVSRHILVVDTSVLAKSNMGRREYIFSEMLYTILFAQWSFFYTIRKSMHAWAVKPADP
jgi:hypothetical protein